MDFATFHLWAHSNGYADDLTIERKNNSGGYSPDNCMWIPQAFQARNKRNNHLITFNGQCKTLAEWAEITGIEPSLIRYRLKHWPIEQALTAPRRRHA
jgi:hypothetical protein